MMFFLKVENKKERLSSYVLQNNLVWAEVLFMGDDIPDYAVMQMVGLACSPADAAVEVKQISKYVSPVKGGSGCARDVIEKVLKQNDDWLMDTSLTSK